MDCILTVFMTITMSFGISYDYEFDPQQSTWKYPWSSTSPFCDANNYMQSPINIDTSTTIKTRRSSFCSPRKELDWNFKGRDRDIIVENTGYSLKITPIVPDDTLTNIDRAVKLNRENDCIAELSNYFNINNDIEDHHDYCLDSIRIHWGINNNVGSQHTINNKQYALEIHFVHFSCDFDNLKNALAEWESYGNGGKNIYVVGIAAVMFDIGDENEAMGMILDKHHRLQEKGQSVIIQDINLNDLLPDYLGYYLYDGSFTIPPCTPCVKWHILSDTLTISKKQLNELRTLLNPIKGPNRALNTNPNTVYQCVQR